MKRTLSFVFSMLILASTYAADVVVNSKVLEIFQQSFSSAEDVSWHETSEHYTVSFQQSAIRATVKYDKKGNMVSSVRYYSPELLPVSIISKVSAANPDAKMFGVTEVTVGNRMMYFINLQSKTNWIRVKVDKDANMEEIEKYNRN